MSIQRVAEILERSKFGQAFSGSATLTNQACNEATGIVVFNDGAGDLVLTVNGKSWTIKSGDLPFDEMFEPFTSFTITASTAFRLYTRG